MATIKEINTSIIQGSFSNDELQSIVSAVVFARNQLARQNKYTFSVGADVQFTNSRTGQTVIGVVNKVNRKTMLVQVGSRIWRVPANMLTRAAAA